MPKISVIVPVYNVEPYLHRCVDSILGQSFSDFELVLVDDGSPDSCGCICEEYAAMDSRIRVIHQENGGLSAARNAGIDLAMWCSDSAWIAFVDSDDWIHPAYLEQLYHAAQKLELPLACCDFQVVREDAPVQERADLFPVSTKKPEDVYICGNRKGIQSYVWRYLIRKDLIGELRFAVGKLWEDMLFTPNILFQLEAVAYVDAKLYCYFCRPGSIVNSPWDRRKLDSIEAIEHNLKLLSDYPSAKLKKNLRHEYLSSLQGNYMELLTCNICEQEKDETIQYLSDKFWNMPGIPRIWHYLPETVKLRLFPMMYPGHLFFVNLYTMVRDNLLDRIRNLCSMLHRTKE